MVNELHNWLEQRKRRQCHRQLVVISGQSEWTYATADKICKQFGESHVWLGDSSFFTARGYPNKQAQKCLGRECDVAIYDAHSGFHASAFLSVIGAIKRNGLMLLCIPPLSDWPEYHAQNEQRMLSYGYQADKSLFLQRWIKHIKNDSNVVLLNQASELIAASDPQNATTQYSPPYDSVFATRDQAELYSRVTDKPAALNVITARRGRGKSTLLGLLAKHFVKLGRKVALCSQHKSNCTQVYQNISEKDLPWFPPDHKSLRQPQDVLLIDEAASLPVPIAIAISKTATTVVLATTVEGYEGTGRGFETRLLPALQANSETTARHHMLTPIRYEANDTLEQHIDKVFMLSASKNNWCPPDNFNTAHLFTSTLVPSTVEFEDLLPEVINILVNAHYKTTPEDIMRVMDLPESKLIVTLFAGKPVAAAVIIEEGGALLSTVAADIASGERRLKGHLLPQLLSLYLAEPDVACNKLWRVQRIAVDQNWQRQGIGKHLLTQINQMALKHSVDIVGSSFGSTTSLCKFWIDCGFYPVKVGNKLDAASGETSLVLVKSLTNKTIKHVSVLRALCVDELETRDNQTIQPIIKQLIQSANHALHVDIDIETVYRRRILDYVNGSRSCLHLGEALTWWLLMLDKNNTSSQIPNILKARWKDKLADEEIIRAFQLTGRKSLYHQLHKAFSHLYWNSVSS